MSYTNFNNSQNENLEDKSQNIPTVPLQNNENKSKLTRNILFGLLGLALLGLVGYGGYALSNSNANNNIATVKKEQAVIADSIITTKDNLQYKYDAINYKLDSMSSTSSKLSATINDKNGEIARQKEEIKRLLAQLKNSDSNSSGYQETVSLLNKKLAELENKANNLEQEMAKLKTENSELTTQNQVVKKERDEVIKANTDLTTNKKELETKIDIGSTLTASNFDMTGINVKNNGKEKESSTAAKIDKLKVTFTIGENKITTAGNKELFLIINDPAGTPLSVEALGSGKLTTREGEQKIYTKKFVVNYTLGQAQPVVVVWEQQADYKKGDYTFEIYQNGFKIGSGKKYLERKKVLGIF